MAANGLVPRDPTGSVDRPLDPIILAIRSALGPFRRRLWLRRSVRRGWRVLAAVLLLEAGLWTVARLVPLERAAIVALAIPIGGLILLVGLALRVRPSIGEVALAVDAEAGLRDRVSSALALALAAPSEAGGNVVPTDEPADGDMPVSAPPVDGERIDPELRDALVRRQRIDALRSLRATPSDLFRPRWSRKPALTALVAAALLAPLIGLPNPQQAVIERDARIRDAAAAQAQTIDKAADKLSAKSQDPNDPRTRLAKDLRDLARQLRDRPDQLDANLARLGSIEDDLQASIDPSTEQRASALTSLSRALSQATTGNPGANPTGDPKQAQQDLKTASDKLDSMTRQEQQDLAAKLAALQQTADAMDGAAGAALRDAAQSLAQGDTASAKAALDRLAKALDATKQKIDVNRDLASAASQLQDSRRQLADAGRPASGQPGQGGQAKDGGAPQASAGTGSGQGSGAGASGSPGTGQGQGQGSGAPGSPGTGQGQGQGQGSGAPGSPGTGQGQGQGQGAPGSPGAGQGQGQGHGQGRAKARARAKARVRGRGRVKAKARGRGRGRSAAAARTPATSAPEPVARVGSAARPAATSPRSSAPT
jgi:hypothetical protein